MKFQHAAARLASLLLLTCGPVRADTPAAAPTFTATQMIADLRQLDRALQEMPADLAHSADPRLLARALMELEAKLAKSPPLTRDQAWREFATLNPLLADGHLLVGFADWRGDVRAHLAGGGRLFPLAVNVTPDCELTVRQDPRSAHHPHAYAIIRTVNGVPGRELCEQLMARVHGDTRVFRADLLSRRFWFFHWKVFGAPADYVVTFEPVASLKLGGRLETIPGTTALPGLLEAEENFRSQFDLHFVAEAADEDPTEAVLRLGTFAWPNKDDVLAFTRQSFESLRRRNIKSLTIDLRDNGGGNDDQWIEGVMPYLARERWRTASRYRKRVVTPDPAKGEKAGDVVDGEMETWFEPQPENPLRFRGKVRVLVGPGTYSSAVVMATVFQDFGFGEVIGTGNAVRANQSGGTRRTTLTNTGLVFVSPRFVLTRPSGAKQPELLAPEPASGSAAPDH
jgi:hypothetical protein